MNLDVVGFGALNLDKLYRVNKIAGRDEEAYITGLTESCGGSAANTIVGLSRLGLKAGFIGKVAGDREGEILLQNLQNEDVNTDGV
ncbi:PfkB family carbohydrate kinase, partial [Methanobacterium aggregans]|uniref:PfkB family carbohydrate kinase n=1 Tax=Methanobacterium aggregans TaxID=1615586 RepID=UPI00320D9564